MDTKTTEKIDDSLNVESDSTLPEKTKGDFNISVSLPTVSTTDDSEYHDDEFLSNGAESDEISNDTDENNNKSDTVIAEKNSDLAVNSDEAREKARGTLDGKGRPFDPAIHIFPPEKTASGIWKKIPKSQRVVNEDGKEVLPTTTNANVRKSAQKVAQWYDNLHVMFFGADGKASNDQMGKLVDSFDGFFQENGAIDLPPHLDLAFTCITHTTEVFKRPTVTEKLMGKIAVWKIKRQIKQAFKGGSISEEQHKQAMHYLSQGLESFTKWQESLQNNGDK